MIETKSVLSAVSRGGGWSNAHQQDEVIAMQKVYQGRTLELPSNPPTPTPARDQSGLSPLSRHYSALYVHQSAHRLPWKPLTHLLGAGCLVVIGFSTLLGLGTQEPWHFSGTFIAPIWDFDS